MKQWFGRRTTAELIVLAIAFTVCSYIIVVTTVLIVDSLWHPDKDTSTAAKQVAGLINTLIGLLAGFLAGRLDLARKNGDDGPDDPAE